MRNQFPKFLFLLICIMVFFLNTALHAQYSAAQIQHAQNELKKWGLLDYLVEKANIDPDQVTTRADVLVACYEIMKELKSYDENLQRNNQSLNNIQRNVSELSEAKAETGLNVSEQQLIEKVTNQVFSGLKHMPEIIDVNTEIQNIKRRIQQVEIVRPSDPERDIDDEVESLKKKAKQAKIIAIVSAGIAAIVGFMSAKPTE